MTISKVKRTYRSEFFLKYRDEFDGISEVYDLCDTLLSFVDDIDKEIAFKNLDNWFITDDIEIRLDYIRLLEGYIEDELYLYLVNCMKENVDDNPF